MSATNSEGAPANLLTGTIHGRPRTIPHGRCRPRCAASADSAAPGRRGERAVTARCWLPRIISRMRIRSFSRRRFRGRSFSGEVRAFPQPRLSLDLAPLRRNPRRSAAPPTALLQHAAHEPFLSRDRTGDLSRGRSLKERRSGQRLARRGSHRAAIGCIVLPVDLRN